MVINYREGRGLQNGNVKFYPYEKGGGADGKTLSHAEGTKRFEVVLTWELEVLAILKGAQNVSTH